MKDVRKGKVLLFRKIIKKQDQAALEFKEELKYLNESSMNWIIARILVWLSIGFLLAVVMLLALLEIK